MSDNLPVVTAPVTLPIDFDTDRMHDVARAVAMNMADDLTPILNEHDLTPEQYSFLAGMPIYQEALLKAQAEWREIKSTQQRVVIKAAHAIEASLLPIASRIQNKLEPLEKVAQMVKVLADITGFSKQNTNVAPEKVTISIDFGAANRLVVEKTVDTSEIRELGEGQSPVITLQPVQEGPPAQPQIYHKPEGAPPKRGLFEVPEG
jgi:hypothetical protein